ncbi:NAD(P)/FAD-dependent oxidoreductase [Deminuibacter soli]|uniref:NAD(P)/FAD-dependent oxidoreductase n=1 Tax=Deminuibacter soli TaxID=2291815 RepID=A0A3E1NPI2_9BACT|nr:NAD(P)/FAD-dependent oxidoreductase [Deminuibacter soli]RFM29845.1 NAD(P)/FAD-dependent oxidoreductase [Deminuibacter soli]
MTENQVYDMAITGGGLAGLSLAIQSANAGYSTVLFEKEHYPFHKVCGEYISMESWPFLERLGIPLGNLQLPRISQLEVSDVKGRLYHFPLDTGGFGISRFKLDQLLYQAALQKGATIHTQSKVNSINFSDDTFTIQTAQHTVQARLATGSFGKRSNLDIQWKRPFIQNRPGKLNQYIAVKYHIRYPQPANTITLHNFENGYCGISRIEDDTCCLCYLTTAANLAAGQSIAGMEERFLFHNPHLQRIFSEAIFLYEQPLTISQVSFQQKEQVLNHVLLTGDAAGLITPLCGNGMSMALHASKLAFEAAIPFLNNTCSRATMEAVYTTQWQQQFGKRLATGRAVQRLFGGNITTSLFLGLMGLCKPAARSLIRATHGHTF